MVTITQNKVAGFEPRWASFSGFSLLFDNPGDATTRASDFLKIACSSKSGGELDLYSGIEKTIEELGRDLLIRTFLFCPLPPPSYHVTVWDGVNADNISSVPAALRAEWTEFLQGIPRSLHAPPTSMTIVMDSDLVKRPLDPMGFRFDKLTMWGNQVLVARLLPADEASEARLKDLCAARATLCDAARRKLGVSPSRSYSPHVSLGYFANQEHGQLARVHLAEWTERFRK